MLIFREILISDLGACKKITGATQVCACEFSFCNMLTWANRYSVEICIYNGFLYMRKKNGGKYSYTFPVGSGDTKAAFELLLASCGDDIDLYLLSYSQKEWLNVNYPDKYAFENYEDGRDYVYLSDNLINLSGRKFHSKRNHIAGFYKNHSDVHFEIINSSDDLQICRSIADEWFIDNYGRADESIDEYHALKLALENYFVIGFSGGILYADSNPVAFTFGEELTPDMFDSHFEKTLTSYKDAYPVINREFAEKCLSSYKYINREDDTGSESLRKAKLSYYPDLLVEKIFAVPCSHVKDLKSLWKTVFEDEDDVINSFFNNVYEDEFCFSQTCDGRVVSALYLIPCEISSTNGVFNGFYLYAAATLPEYRSKGYMKKLLKKALDFSAGYDFICLSPANDSLYGFYESVGFDSVLYSAITTGTDICNSDNIAAYIDVISRRGCIYFSESVYKYLTSYSSLLLPATDASQEKEKCGAAKIFNDSLHAENIIIYNNLS